MLHGGGFGVCCLFACKAHVTTECSLFLLRQHAQKIFALVLHADSRPFGPIQPGLFIFYNKLMTYDSVC